MGHPEISEDTFGYESKTTLGLRNSIDDVTPIPAQESKLQLFETQPSLEEQQWTPDLRDWLVFVNILILAMMDTFDATVMMPVLPVRNKSPWTAGNLELTFRFEGTRQSLWQTPCQHSLGQHHVSHYQCC